MRHDDLDLDDYALLQPGKYKGHIWNYKKHKSNPKEGTGETFDMFLIEVRVDRTEGGQELIRPRRIFLDTWPNRAAGIKRSFVSDDEVLKGFEMPDEEKAKWKDPKSVLGRPCNVELAHETYRTKSGEEATKHLIERMYPDFDGEILDETSMDGIDSIERHSAEAPDEEMPVASDKPPF